MAVSTVAQIIAITEESSLIQELGLFEKAVEKRIEPIENLLSLDIKSANEFTLEQHMSKIDSYRQISVKIHALASCFLEHAKSPYFALAKGTGFERESKQKQLTAPFQGMVVRYEGLVKSIDSRVNMVKTLLRLQDEREKGMR